MFSLDNFYYVLYKNFLQPHGMTDGYFKQFGSVSPDDLCQRFHDHRLNAESKKMVLYYDQEPLFEKFFNNLMTHPEYYAPALLNAKYSKILANSEHSQVKKDLCQENGYIDWYYFFHGLAALEWFRDYKYIPKIDVKFTKVFICLNHLVTKERSYRLQLVANLLDRDLVKHGAVSCSLNDGYSDWFSELFKSPSLLSKDAKKLIYAQFSKLEGPLRVDTQAVHGSMSAQLNLPMQQDSLWHVVTETVFYHDKLHLTEKIFKPIVARRPFILVGAPGNLAYLKSYGFKTFDRWIDESYDNITDPDQRIAAIVSEIEKLCKLSPTELDRMYNDMREILNYNYSYFYGDFKRVVVTEMVNNFEKCLKQINVGLDHRPDELVDVSCFDREGIIQRLCQ